MPHVSLNGGQRILLDQALLRYAEDRDISLAEGYDATLAVAQLETPEMRLSLLRAVQADPELTATYFDLIAGVESTRALYTPRLLALL